MADDAAAPTDVRRLRAAAHPLRLRMLSLLTGTEMSAAEVARALGTTHANASYHLRVLLDAGEVVVAGEEVVRGGVAKRYRHPWRERSEDRTPGDRSAQVRAMAQELVRRFDERRPGGRSTLSDAELWVSPAAWDRAVATLLATALDLHEAAVPPGSDGARPVALTLAAFELRTPDDEARP